MIDVVTQYSAVTWDGVTRMTNGWWDNADGPFYFHIQKEMNRKSKAFKGKDEFGRVAHGPYFTSFRLEFIYD